MKRLNTMLAFTALVVSISGSAAFAETTITTTTTVSPQVTEDAETFDFSGLDTNNDDILTTEEVGGTLFYIFDRDGNEVLDNIEFSRQSLMTITPMEKETLTTIDVDNDGTAEETVYSYDTFLQASQLTRFSDDYSGLSPEEFIGESFLELDANDDKGIEFEEWQDAYLDPTIYESADQERYND